eukprot:gene48913-31180_t
MLSLPAPVRERFTRLRKGDASSDFMQPAGPGGCVLVRMDVPHDAIRALSLKSTSLYHRTPHSCVGRRYGGEEGELLFALGTLFEVTDVFRGRMLTRYVAPTKAAPVSCGDLCKCACREPLLVVDC